MVSQLVRFVGAKGGNVALTVSLLAAPLLLAAGATVDYSSLNRFRSEMQNAANSAALAAAAADESLSDDALKDLVKSHFNAHGDVEVSRRIRLGSEVRKTFVEVRAFSRVNSILMDVFGRRFTDIRVTARANRIRSGLELALVIDTTKSMNFGMSWPDTASAISDLLDDLQHDTARRAFYATLIPFNARVNIGTSRNKWLRETGNLANWEGCVEPQEKPVAGFPYRIELQKPGAVFRPTVPGQWSGTHQYGRTRDCVAEITGPAHELSDVKDALRSLKPTHLSNGRYDTALAWGWRAVSAQWKGHWDQGPNYPSQGKEIRQKAIALFTDGHTDINTFELEKAKGEFGRNNGSETSFSHFANLCEEIKSEGIEVFIFHVLGNYHAKPYFRQCAEENYFGIETGEEFEAALAELGKTGDLIKLVR